MDNHMDNPVGGPMDIASFDPEGNWGQTLVAGGCLRGHGFADILAVRTQHAEQIRDGRRSGSQAFPRVLGTRDQWRRAGWQVRDDAVGYARLLSAPGTVSPRLYGLTEVIARKGTDASMFDPAGSAGPAGELLRYQGVSDGLTGLLTRCGYHISYARTAGIPVTRIDHSARTVSLPETLPGTEQIAELAHTVAGALRRRVDARSAEPGYAEVQVIESSAAHLVMTATGLDPRAIAFPVTALPVEPDTGRTLGRTLLIGQTALACANLILGDLQARGLPVRHDGTTTPPGAHSGPSPVTGSMVDHLPGHDPGPLPPGPGHGRHGPQGSAGPSI